MQIKVVWWVFPPIITPNHPNSDFANFDEILIKFGMAMGVKNGEQQEIKHHDSQIALQLPIKLPLHNYNFRTPAKHNSHAGAPRARREANQE